MKSSTPLFSITQSPTFDDITVIELQAIEAISQPYRFRVTLTANCNTLDSTQFIGQPFGVAIQQRTYSGIIEQFSESHETSICHLELVPTLQYLAQTKKRRHFRQRTPLEIIRVVLQENHIINVSIKCLNQYSSLDYCVQYDETDLRFIERLMHQHGMCYTFINEQLLITDHSHRLPRLPHDLSMDPNLGEIIHWQERHQLNNTHFKLSDYYFKQPNHALTVSNHHPFQDDLQRFHFPGGFSQLDQAETALRLAERSAAHSQIEIIAATRVCELHAGMHIRVQGNEHLICRAYHHAVTSNSGLVFHNNLVCIPVKQNNLPIKCMPVTHRHGIEKALVATPHHALTFCDDFARIQLTFNWENTPSYWVRSVQPWCGKHWGMQFVARRGHEMIVHSLYGNPTLSIVTGSIYQRLPFNLFTSGIKTHIDDKKYHAIYFDDQLSQEKIGVYSQGNLTYKTGNEAHLDINNHYHISVKQGNHQILVEKGTFYLHVNKGMRFQVGNNYIALTKNKVIVAGKTININS